MIPTFISLRNAVLIPNVRQAQGLLLILASVVLNTSCSSLAPTAPKSGFSYRGKCGNLNLTALTFDYVDPSRTKTFVDNRPYFKYAYNHPDKCGFHKGNFSAPNLSLSGSGNSLTLVKSGGNNVTFDLDAQAVARNSIIYELMGIADDYYGHYTDKQLGFVQHKNFFADVLGIATSSASSIAGAAGTKTILSAISSGVQSASGDFDKDILLQQSMQAIKSSMDAERHQVGMRIYLRMRNNVTAYPLEAGLRDVVRYYYAGTMTAGLERLAETSTSDKTSSKDNETKANPASGSPSSSSSSTSTTKKTKDN